MDPAPNPSFRRVDDAYRVSPFPQYVFPAKAGIHSAWVNVRKIILINTYLERYGSPPSRGRRGGGGGETGSVNGYTVCDNVLRGEDGNGKM